MTAMISASHRVDAVNSQASTARNTSSASSTTSSFAQEVASAVEGYLNKSNSGSPLNINISEVSGQNSGGSQFLVTVTPGGSNSVTPISSGPNSGSASTTTTTTTQASNIPTMLGMGPVAGTAPVQQAAATTKPITTTPVSEVDAYWNAQPAAVQALRNMPDGQAKNQLALNLSNQGYAIDTQIMVWGWDPQMTMTVRENQGYSWVPSFGGSNIPVGPGLSMPDNPSTYNPGNPPAGSVQVSTAFVNGSIQNPLVQNGSSNT
jgi:hypothetical protein